MPFLLKQAAWLYEKQLADVRAQMRRIGNSRPTSIVGGHELSLAAQAQARSGSLSGNNTGGVAFASGSGSGTSMTVKGSRSAQGRGSFRDLASNMSQVRSGLGVAGSPVDQAGVRTGLDVAGSPIDQAATQPSSAALTPRPAYLQLGPPAHSFRARPPPLASTRAEPATSDDKDDEDDAEDEEDDDDDVENERHRTFRRSSLFRPTRILSPSERSGGSSPRFLPFLAGGDDISEKSGDTADEDYDDSGGSSRREQHDTVGRQARTRQGELGHTLRGEHRHQQPATAVAASPRTASSVSDLDGKYYADCIYQTANNKE